MFTIQYICEQDVLLEGQVRILQKSCIVPFKLLFDKSLTWSWNNNLAQYWILIPIACVAIKFMSKQKQNKNCEQCLDIFVLTNLCPLVEIQTSCGSNFQQMNIDLLRHIDYWNISKPPFRPGDNTMVS